MRKKYLISCMTVFFLTVPAAAFSAANDKAGDVVAIRGSAMVQREETEFRAEKKLVLLEKDYVETGEKSRLKMLFRDDSILALGSMSRLSVNQYLYSPEEKRSESIYELLDGKLRAVVGSADFSVKTPTAFAAARGTIFVVWYDPETESTLVAVLEGEVFIRNIDESVGGGQTVSAGQMVKIAGNTPPTIPEAFQIINATGEVTGTDIGPIVYEVTMEETPEVVFVDNWKGEAGQPEYIDWEDGGPPGILLEGDVYSQDPARDADINSYGGYY